MAEAALRELEGCWATEHERRKVIPGKDALSNFNRYLQSEFDVSITPTGIVDAMRVDEVPAEVRALLADISRFAQTSVD